MAHAVGNWKAPPGGHGGQSFAGCMPFRHNGLRSETAASVKGEVLAAMRDAHKRATAASAPDEKYWQYMPKNLQIWAACRQEDGDTDAEEEMQMDVEGSDASEDADAPSPASPQEPKSFLTGNPLPHVAKKQRVDALVPPEQPAVVPPCHAWATTRRGPNTRYHYAAGFEALRSATGDTPEHFGVRTVCRKFLARAVNAAEDPSVLYLPICERCQSTGPRKPLPDPPWSSA